MDLFILAIKQFATIIYSLERKIETETAGSLPQWLKPGGKSFIQVSPTGGRALSHQASSAAFPGALAKRLDQKQSSRSRMGAHMEC